MPCHAVLQRPIGYPSSLFPYVRSVPPLPHRAVSHNIKTALQKLPGQNCSDVVLLFSAHSLSMSVVNRCYPYVSEVSATAAAVMDRLGHMKTLHLVRQSQTGPSARIGPQTSDALKGLAHLGKTCVVRVPIRIYERSHGDVMRARPRIWEGGPRGAIILSSPLCYSGLLMRRQFSMEVQR